MRGARAQTTFMHMGKTIKEERGLQTRRPSDVTAPVCRIYDLVRGHPSFRVTEPSAPNN
jgi:hypothetical protein